MQAMLHRCGYGTGIRYWYR
ncbi:hypothetical protein A2U01_0082455, partial [Trifolium medium]|nr:hypothetical protein [Trifolium medium]